MSHLTSEERQRLINSIPEATVFDAHKENIMPRAEGRSAAMLNELCQMDPSEKEQVQKKGHLKFKQELDNIDDSDDPLGVYVAYVDWILSHYHPGDTRGSNLLPTLKAATESFVDDVRYKQHPSYLKLWLEYANWVEEPVTIYRYLTGKDIGQSVALFYETYAGYLERKVQYDDAKNVFEHGISNNAMPRDRLERNYNKLKERIKQRKAVKPQHKERSEELKAAGRTTLGVKSSSDSPYSQPSNVYNRTQSLYGAPTQSSSSIGRDYSNTTRSKDTFRVFKEAAAPSTALPTSAPRQLNVRATQSENKVRPVPMAGAILKQAPFTPPPQTKKFSIYRDTESVRSIFIFILYNY
jgi:hypothetical protein